MASKTRIKAKLQGNITEVKTLINHPMDTGLGKDQKTGATIPAYFIKEVSWEHNGKKIMSALWGIAISRNPYLSFTFAGGVVGDTVKVSWIDSKGETAAEQTTISTAE